MYNNYYPSTNCVNHLNNNACGNCCCNYMCYNCCPFPICIQGPTGPQGPQGIQGPTGPSSQMDGIQVVLDNGIEFDNNSNIIFNTIQNTVGSSINYDTITGNFTITEAGNYDVSWWIATGGAAASPIVAFSLQLDAVEVGATASSVTEGNVSGNALITVSTVPATLSLLNNSGDVVFIPTLPIEGSLVITGPF